MEDINSVYLRTAEEAENACRYIFDAIDAGDRMMGVRWGNETYEVVFQETDGNEVAISIAAIFKMASLLRREPVIE
jgi:hypothetical protein